MSALFYIIFSLVTVWLTVLGWYDCYYRRLPNYLTFGGAAAFLILRMFDGSFDSILNGLLGGLVGGLFLFIPFLLRGAGAGDVKMFFAVGILMGVPAIFLVLIFSTVFGLLLGFVMLLAGRVNPARLKHLFKSCFFYNYDREEGRKNLPEKTNEAVRIPFGVAIAAGTWCGLLLNVFARP